MSPKKNDSKLEQTARINVEVKVGKFEKFIRVITAVLTLCLVIVGIWYSYETRGLKILSENQLSEIRTQFKLSNAPFLFPTVVDRKVVKKSIIEGVITQTAGNVRYSKEEL